MTTDPLPFRLKRPGWDTMGFSGIESVSHRADGLLRLSDHGITLEWAEVQTVEQLSFDRVGTDVNQLPAEWLELPLDRLTGAWLVGGWWLPRLELRARSMEDFKDVPGVRGVTLTLRIQRRDRPLAQAITAALTSRIQARAAGA